MVVLNGIHAGGKYITQEGAGKTGLIRARSNKINYQDIYRKSAEQKKAVDAAFCEALAKLLSVETAFLWLLYSVDRN